MARPNAGQFKKGNHWRARQPWWDKTWLAHEYVTLQRSAAEIAQDGSVGETAILYWLKKHGIRTRTMSEVRTAKRWGAPGADNPMWNRRGELNPNWKGGVTAERQAFYTSEGWKAACRLVWKRDKARCRRCGLHRDEDPAVPFHIHHVVPFSDDVELRADPQNLILLCEPCHHFVHSKRNVRRDYLPRK